MKTIISPKNQDRSIVIDRECKRNKSENYLLHNITHVPLSTLLHMHHVHVAMTVVQFQEMLRQAEPRVSVHVACIHVHS